MKYFFALLAVFFLLAAPAYADIYKYTDENGVICYTDTPLGKKADRLLKEKSVAPLEAKKGSSKRSGDVTDYHSIVYDKASVYDIDPSLIKAVIKTESNWNSRAISRKGAIGLMQLMPGTAVDMNVRNPFDPEENIEGGTRYLRYLLERFNGDLTLALAAYNAGPKTVEKFGYVPPITETRQYVNKVLSLYNGKMTYPAAAVDKQKPIERIYKIVMEDGTVLFTNSSLVSNRPVRF
ncbi:MAG: lytic transglycosylase domain-containing protein [Nitrospirota bacterium]